MNLGNEVTKDSMIAYATEKRKFVAYQEELEYVQENPWIENAAKTSEELNKKLQSFKETILQEINRFTDEVINTDPHYYGKLNDYDFPEELLVFCL